MHNHLIELVERLGRPRVLVVGDLMRDRYVFGDAERISPEAPVQVLRVAGEENRLGGAGSVVSNLTVLGARVSVFSVLGRDALGAEILGELKAAGARAGGVLRVADRPTTLKTRFVGRAQHRHPQQVLRVDREDTRPLPRQVEDRLLAKIGPALRTADLVVVSDYNKGVVTPRLAQEIIRRGRRLGVPVVADPIKAPDYSKYRGATLLTPNRLETELASGMRLAGDDAIRRAARRLVRDLRLNALVVTLDKDGAYLSVRGKPGQAVPTRPRPVYDNAGAGDMVISVIAMVLAAGAPLLDAVRLANVAGGLEVQKFGVQSVSREEMIAELLDEGRHAGSKVRTLDHLLADLARHRAMGRSIVFTNGCFDLIHSGHVTYMEFAGAQGDVLVVGLNSDRSVRANKGPSRPICSQDERARVLAALEVIDYITIFDEPSVLGLIQRVRPDVLVKGADYGLEGVVGRDFVESYGGRVVLAPLLKGLSTSELVRRVQASEGRPPQSARKGGAK